MQQIQYLLCTYSEHQQPLQVSSVCLDKLCNSKRFFCNECISLHINHQVNQVNCFSFNFMIKILQEERRKLELCLKLDLTSYLIKQTEKLINQIEDAINNLEKQEYQDLNSIIKLTVNCYNGEILDILVYHVNSKESDQRSSYIKQLQSCYTLVDFKYLAEFLMEQGIELFMQVIPFAYQKIILMQLKNIKQLEELIGILFFKIKQMINQVLKLSFVVTLYFIGNKQESLQKEIEKYLKFQDDDSKKQSNYKFQLFSQIGKNMSLLNYIQPFQTLFSSFLIDCYSSDQSIQQGLCLIATNKIIEAISYFDQLIHRNKQDVKFAILKLLALVLANQFTEALILRNEKLELFPNEKFFIEAKNICKITLDDSISVPLNNFSLCQQFLTFIKKCQFSKVLRLMEQNEWFSKIELTQVVKAIILIHINRKTEGISILRKINCENRFLFQSIVVSYQAHLLRLQERFQESYEASEIYFNKTIENEDILLEKIAIFFEKGTNEDYNFIIEYYNQSPVNNPLIWSAKGLLMLSLANFKLKYFEQALGFLDVKYNRIQVNHPIIFFLKGKIQFHLNEFVCSVSINAVLVKYKSQCFSFVEVWYREILSKKPILSVSCRKGLFAKAVLDFNQVIRMNKSYWPAIYNKGIAWLKQSIFDAAKTCFNETTKNDIRSRLLIIYCELCQTHYGDATSMAKQYLESNTKYCRAAQLLLIASLIGSHYYEEAKQVILKLPQKEKKAKQDNSQYLQKEKEVAQLILLYKGIIYYEQQLSEELTDWFEKALKTEECKSVAFLLQGKLQQQNNDQEAALASYEQCLIFDPNCLPALIEKCLFQTIIILVPLLNIDQSEKVITLSNQILKLTGKIEQQTTFLDMVLQHCYRQLRLENKLNEKELLNTQDRIDMLNFVVTPSAFIAYEREILRQ